MNTDRMRRSTICSLEALTGTGTGSLRALLVLVPIAAMARFLTMEMAIPEVFGAVALTFGLSYLFVSVPHLGAFRSTLSRAG